MEPLIGQIMIFGGNFTPRGWAFCDGQLLPIMQNTSLYSILGTTYGGDGRNTFGLPDLRGRIAIGEGQGQGLSTRHYLGSQGQFATENCARGNHDLDSGVHYTTVNYIIALEGTFPSRS